MDRYEQISVVGEGSYGIVMKCRHKETDQVVAIKKFLETEEDAAVRRMALREIRMLKKLRHENLVTMIEVFRHRKRFYLVFEHLDGTVLDELEKNPGGLGDEQSRERIFQVLRAIQYCHSNQIIHRDVKPENVLVSSLGVVKLCDFGFARLIGVNGEPCTEYVATRWYRAPELLVNEQQYGYAVDIWAIGCLFAEMMTGDPLFPGESDIDQLYLIVKMLGKPCLRHQQAMTRSTQLRGIMRSAAMDSTGLYREYPNWPLLALDFLSAAVKMDPTMRLSAEELLSHNYFSHDKFHARFLPEIREKVNKEFGENPLLRRYRVEILMSTDKKDEAIRQQQLQAQQAQRRGSQAEMHRWRFNLLEGSIKRKYSYETNACEQAIKPYDPRAQKLNFIRREAQVNTNLAYKNTYQTNKRNDINKDTFDEVSLVSKDTNQSNEIQKLERSLENLTKLGAKRSSSAQNELGTSREPSPPLFQSLQSQIEDENCGRHQSIQKTNNFQLSSVPTKEGSINKDFQQGYNNSNNNNGNGSQTLQPSIHNINFERFGKGNEFVKKSSPNLLQSIQTVRGIQHTNIPMFTPQPRGSQLFLKRLDRNVITDPIQQHVSSQVQNLPSQPAGDGMHLTQPSWGSFHNHSQHLARKRERDNYMSNIVGNIPNGFFQTESSGVAKTMSGAAVVGVLTGQLPTGKAPNKSTLGTDNASSNTSMENGFSLPMLPGATNTPKKRFPHITNTLTLQGVTPEVRYKKAKRKYNGVAPIPPLM